MGLGMDGLVSVVMPAYNSEEYIADSIKSVLAQTYENIELLIVDDHSTDHTVEIIRSFDDPRIVLSINQENRGAAYSRNRAIQQARGRWIAFLDSDDQWKTNKLERQLAFMQEKGYAFTFTDYRICLNGKWLPYIITGPDVITKRKLYNYCYLSTITVVYDVQVVGKIQIADIKKRNDYAIWLKAVEKTEFHRFPECLSYYIKHDHSLSSGSKIRLIKYHYIMFRKVLGKGHFFSVLLTMNNLFHGVIKRYRFRKYLDWEKTQNVTL